MRSKSELRRIEAMYETSNKDPRALIAIIIELEERNRLLEEGVATLQARLHQAMANLSEAHDKISELENELWDVSTRDELDEIDKERSR